MSKCLWLLLALTTSCVSADRGERSELSLERSDDVHLCAPCADEAAEGSSPRELTEIRVHHVSARSIAEFLNDFEIEIRNKARARRAATGFCALYTDMSKWTAENSSYGYDAARNVLIINRQIDHYDYQALIGIVGRLDRLDTPSSQP